MINYLRLAQSIEFYAQAGFKRIEAPWWVPNEIMNITLPEGKDPIDTLYYLAKNKKSLVASGEQSLLYLANQGLLPGGKYQTVTPCFRDEVQGPTRRKFFMKNELMVAGTQSESELQAIIQTAMEFFKTQVPDASKLQVVKTKEGFDIEYGGIELGSYGIRRCSFLDWVYGTGVAEPRTERAIRMAHLAD